MCERVSIIFQSLKIFNLQYLDRTADLSGAWGIATYVNLPLVDPVLISIKKSIIYSCM